MCLLQITSYEPPTFFHNDKITILPCQRVHSFSMKEPYYLVKIKSERLYAIFTLRLDFVNARYCNENLTIVFNAQYNLDIECHKVTMLEIVSTTERTYRKHLKSSRKQLMNYLISQPFYFSLGFCRQHWEIQLNIIKNEYNVERIIYRAQNAEKFIREQSEHEDILILLCLAQRGYERVLLLEEDTSKRIFWELKVLELKYDIETIEELI